MTTSGTYNTVANFSVVEWIDEAFRRCQVDQSKIESEHLTSARISLNLLFIDWVNDGVEQFIIDQQTYTLTGTSSDSNFTTPVGTVDVLNMVFRNSSNTDMEISAISRQDYEYISQKTASGQPVNYFVDKTTMPAVVYLWPVQNITGTSVVYNRLRQIQDVGNYSNTLDVSVLYTSAAISGLAARLAEKYCTPDLEDRLISKYQEAYEKAKDQDRDRAQLVIKPRLGRRYY